MSQILEPGRKVSPFHLYDSLLVTIQGSTTHEGGLVKLVYALKATGVAALAAASELWANGQHFIAFAAIPMLLTMWWATRQHARRRARMGERS